MNKNKWRAVIGAAIIGIAIFAYSITNSRAAVREFAKAYQASYAINNTFLVGVVATNVNENPALVEFQESYQKVIDSMQTSVPNKTRLALAEEAISLREKLDEQLKKSEITEEVASDALLDLNMKAARIKDADLKKSALEIADLSQEYYDTVRDYKYTIYAKSEMQKKLAKTIIDANGGTAGFIAFLKNKDNQTKLAGQNEKIENADFADIDTRLTQAFARFKGTASISD